MAPLACISVPALSLQIATRRFPPPVDFPLVLVKRDRPTSPILALNRTARALGLRIGMRYGEALTVASEVRAIVISDSDVTSAHEELLSTLSRWSPKVEICPFDPGTFWLESSGLTGLFGSQNQWGNQVRGSLETLRFRALVVLGWTRSGTYLLAQSKRRSLVLTSPEAETRAQAEVPLEVLPLSVRHRRLLAALGIWTWGTLQRMSPKEVSKRLGPELLREILQLRNLDAMPLQPAVVAPQRFRRIRFDYAVDNPLTLHGYLEEPLKEGLLVLTREGLALKNLKLRMVREDSGILEETIRPGHPTVDPKGLHKLLGLRLESIDLRPGVTEAQLFFDSVPAQRSTGELFAPPVVRDLARGDEALALVRAQFGNDTVVRPALGPSNLPEESYFWEPFDRLQAPPVQEVAPPSEWAVRRVPLDQGKDASAPVGQRVSGPFELFQVSETSVTEREYWFLRSRNREIHWVYWDKQSRQNRWQGVVD